MTPLVNLPRSSSLQSGFESDGNAREHRSRSFLYNGNVLPGCFFCILQLLTVIFHRSTSVHDYDYDQQAVTTMRLRLHDYDYNGQATTLRLCDYDYTTTTATDKLSTRLTCTHFGSLLPSILSSSSSDMKKNRGNALRFESR